MTAIAITNSPDNPKLVNGSILVVRPIEHPYILHFGILLFDLGTWRIMHNNEDKNVHIEDLDQLLKRTEFVTILPSPMTGKDSSFLLKRFALFQVMRYDVVEYNCETFVNQFTYQKPISPQAIAYTLLAAFWLFMILFWLWKQKLRSLL